MGLADFLVEAGQGTGAARVGRAMGGTNRRVDDFFNNQLKPLAEEIHANTDENKIPELGIKLLKAASDAGIPAQSAEKLMEMFIHPALNGIRQEGLNRLFDQYRGQPAIEAQSRPEINGVPKEGPLTPQGNFIDPKAATPDKPLDLNFINKFGQLTKANPEQYNKMLETPSIMAGHQLSNQKTQQAIDAETAAQKAIGELSNTPQGPGQPSAQQVARINRPGIVQFTDQRKKEEDPLLEERRALLTSQAGAADARAIATIRGPAGSGGSTTTSERTVDPAKQADAGRQIAQAAKERGMTSPEQIRQIADDFGYTITGDAKVEETIPSAFGVSNPKLGGTYSLTPKDTTKTTTKGAPGNQGGYSKKPSGSAPIAPTSPKRMKFDAKGNLVQ